MGVGDLTRGSLSAAYGWLGKYAVLRHDPGSAVDLAGMRLAAARALAAAWQALVLGQKGWEEALADTKPMASRVARRSKADRTRAARLLLLREAAAVFRSSSAIFLQVSTAEDLGRTSQELLSKYGSIPSSTPSRVK